MVRPGYVKVVEVGPRDGLQNEPTPVPTHTKIELIERLGDSGLRTIEVTAFVSPKWVPQMADHTAVMAGIRRKREVSYPALVPNLQGFHAARAAGAEDVAVFAAASESFSRNNINCSVDQSLERFEPVLAAARQAGVRVRGYVSCVLGCPYEGEVAPSAVAAVARRLADMGCYEVSLGDTIGVGTPAKAARLVAAVAEHVPAEHIAVHFHDTYGQALANVLAVLDQGISVIDSAVAGLGGCPYARGASGNLATEDLLYLLNGLEIETGVDLERVAAAGWYICDALGRTPSSRVSLAMRARSERC